MTYLEFFQRFYPATLKEYEANRHEDDGPLRVNEEAEVLFLGNHHQTDRELAVIRTNRNKVYLIAVDALEVIDVWDPIIEMDDYEAMIFG